LPHPALFLDRDGVVNEEVGYLHRPAEVRFVDGIFSLCRTAQALGYRLVIVTNQSGIARGFYTIADFDLLMAHFRAEMLLESVSLDAVYFCPYHPVHGIGEFQRESPDRKPAPGMLLRAAADLDLDLTRSILIGDRCSDLAAAEAAGLRQAFLLVQPSVISPTEPAPCPSPHRLIAHLAEAEAWIVANL
jgi:D-glycero-D-manno-heptose 1,7-bisphosphate phosphatase